MSNVGETLESFFQDHCLEMANERNWQCDAEDCPMDCKNACSRIGKGMASQNSEMCYKETCKDSCWRDCKNEAMRRKNCGMIRSVTTLISKLSAYLPSVPIYELSFFDIQRAMNRVITDRKGNEYSTTTIAGYYSHLRVVFRFAEQHGYASNILKICSNEDVEAICSQSNKGLRESVIDEYIEKNLNKPRSLSTAQLEKLVDRLQKNIENDGRYCAVALALYAGCRPAELRFLRWEHIKSFEGHSGKHYLIIYDNLRGDLSVRHGVKTRNAYRKIPVHKELWLLLERRRRFVKSNVGGGKSIEGYPICCLENKFDTPCRDYQVSILVEKIFDSIKLSVKERFPFILDLIRDGEKKKGSDREEENLTLYVLRRTFWTMMNACTQMSDWDKRYVMGHEIVINKRNQRDRYNHAETIYELGEKMDRCVFSRKYHESIQTVELKENERYDVDNVGVVYLRISKESLQKGGILRGSLCTEECGDPIAIAACDSPKLFQTMKLEIKSCESVPRKAGTVGINCEYDNWKAHKKAAATRRT